MRVCLVHLDLATHSPPESVPLGVLYLAATLEADGIPVSIRDVQLADAAAPDPVERLVGMLDPAAQVVGISCMSNMMPLLLASLEPLRARHPDQTLVLGGWGPTVHPEQIMAGFPEVDYILSGWAEASFLQLIRAVDDRSDVVRVPGLTWRDGTAIRTNPVASRNDDIDSLPSPAWNLVRPGDYRNPYSVVSTRGCPFDCAFCDIPGFTGRRVVVRSVDHVLVEIEGLLAMTEAPLKLSIVDDTFLANRRRAEAFCEGLRKRGLDVHWAASGRVDEIDPRLLDRMSEAGCRGLFLGLESGSDAILGTIGKGFTSDDAWRAVQMAMEYIGAVNVGFIWGLPSEDLGAFKETLASLAFCRALGADIQCTLWSPLPRSRLYREHRDELVFCPETISTMVAGLGDTVERYQDIIRRYPEICAPFYHYPHSDLDERWELLRKLGIRA